MCVWGVQGGKLQGDLANCVQIAWSAVPNLCQDALLTVGVIALHGIQVRGDSLAERGTVRSIGYRLGLSENSFPRCLELVGSQCLLGHDSGEGVACADCCVLDDVLGQEEQHMVQPLGTPAGFDQVELHAGDATLPHGCAGHEVFLGGP